MSIDWNDPRNTGAAPAISNMQTITVTSGPPVDWQARATAAEAENATLRDALGSVPIPGKYEHADHFYARMELWLNGPYRQARAALETDNG